MLYNNAMPKTQKNSTWPQRYERKRGFRNISVPQPLHAAIKSKAADLGIEIREFVIRYLEKIPGVVVRS